MLDLLKRGTVAVEGKRVFVPGCGRGYDPVTFIKAGAKEAIGLELAPSATPAANEYIAAQSVDTSKCYVETGDFFKWKDPAGFDVGYDYTFLCAMHPTMREDWAKAWHGHLSPGGKLITLIFPINPAADPGPPWYIHADMCKELLIPAGTAVDFVTKGGGPITDKEASLRVEVESPFRSLRIIVLGFCIASAGIGSLFSLVYILKDGPDAWKNLGINAGVVAVAAWLLRRDLKARGTAVNRVMREGQLGACEVQLQNGRRLRLADLRGSARVVIMVGTREQVEAAVGAAEPFRERLQAAGVLLVPAAIYDQGSGTSDGAAPQASAADLKWVAQPVRLAEWRTWFEQQTKSQGTPTAGGLYISLRLDGRIRASGRGSPPWEQLAAQLPSVSGFFGGFLDGMDGRV
ncbi:hypothetical protein APUTEX25_004840 [Auxenochlorella protothecoides]|uniref:Thiol methyltransferase 2 n=1 Tax=Auxenochlorella protothecoides TaxID=3075 RepID=A0A3M7KVH5_AUXPR|nr:hypothetical protein APUTEX25_004840 [Auxenochlorella protothecoides]|eukprot:RMZ53352.1 hypothetical protein APUTEX25_004840 [Auxenochlorella protothecoides]